MPFPIHIHNKEEVLELEREAYHGGRTSVFYQGTIEDKAVYYVDVNSMYPYVMKRYYYPIEAHEVKHSVSLGRLTEWLDKYSVIADVLVNTDEPVYQIKKKVHSYHPTGVFRVTLCTPELQYALAHNHIVRVYRAVYYNNAPIFRDYVDYFYALKQQYGADGNKPFRS